MSEVKKILEMIESVDPNDTETLDEIDARVVVWLEPALEYIGVRREPDSDMFGEPVEHHAYKQKDGREFLIYPDEQKQYTRSRDALKSIRPEGWQIVISNYATGFWTVVLSNDGLNISAPSYLKTEELAELHAIIQAIEWERQNSKTE